MAHFKIALLVALSLVAMGLGLNYSSSIPSFSGQTQTAPDAIAKLARAAAPANANRAKVCSLLRDYPRPPGEKLSFEAGRISPLCQPFVRGTRETLDRCGDPASDPYTKTKVTQSQYTWPSRNEMQSRGKSNLFADEKLQTQLPVLYNRIEEIRESAASMCCGGDAKCRAAMNGVEVSICRPKEDPDEGDPCVFGGTYEMAGRNYTTIFSALSRLYADHEDTELKSVAARNVSTIDPERLKSDSVADALSLIGGRIILTSYVPKKLGVKALEPTIHHEFGHACSMVRMQMEAGSGRDPITKLKALRALNWLDRVKKRCTPDIELPEAYYDFWESIGETRELASCLFKLTDLNRTQAIDRPCKDLCPGHYLEEAVGVAFSLLNGDLRGLTESVYPNTCDHMRDRQHPMVSDVVECLAQHSPRFRERLASAYACGGNVASRASHFDTKTR